MKRPILVAVALAVILAACGGGSDDAAPTTTTAAPATPATTAARTTTTQPFSRAPTETSEITVALLPICAWLEDGEGCSSFTDDVINDLSQHNRDRISEYLCSYASSQLSPEIGTMRTAEAIVFDIYKATGAEPVDSSAAGRALALYSFSERCPDLRVTFNENPTPEPPAFVY